MKEFTSFNGHPVKDAVARNFIKFSKSYVTPEEFGAVGDGVTDDTLAFETALATGLKVVCQSALYKVTSLILKNESCLLGYKESWGSTTIICNNGIRIEGNKNTLKYITIKSGITDRYNVINSGLYCCGKTENGEGRGDNHFYGNFIDGVIISYFENGIFVNGVLWDCYFSNIKIEMCKKGFTNTNKYNITTTQFKNVYFSGCIEKNMELHRSTISFENCNFGFSVANHNITCTENSNIIFSSCNFECDKFISEDGILILVTGNSAKFVNCVFSISVSNNTSVIDSREGVESLIIENCRYISVDLESPNALNKFFHITVNAKGKIYGCIKIIGSPSIPNQIHNGTDYRVGYNAYPYFFIEEYGAISYYNSDYIDTGKLKVGQRLYSHETNKYMMFNGTDLIEV